MAGHIDQSKPHPQDERALQRGQIISNKTSLLQQRRSRRELYKTNSRQIAEIEEIARNKGKPAISTLCCLSGTKAFALLEHHSK
jgi:hypothetical protein